MAGRSGCLPVGGCTVGLVAELQLSEVHYEKGPKQEGNGKNNPHHLEVTTKYASPGHGFMDT